MKNSSDFLSNTVVVPSASRPNKQICFYLTNRCKERCESSPRLPQSLLKQMYTNSRPQNPPEHFLKHLYSSPQSLFSPPSSLSQLFSLSFSSIQLKSDQSKATSCRAIMLFNYCGNKTHPTSNSQQTPLVTIRHV